ncbi:Calcium-binding mitochondrial carrier protein SCaMC-3 [Anabarilius grahami]|uniref:Calcium-binding mitochondrial carrier protein SCaMC-3 n=1 Tax=Anabarilius grahami TaxID=495550 RepID=A0A3N0Y0J7_ANAGA|nr:Calcium-binding mitochondrial carrier protein SCaMC-3 [Anabarilius grahami]
MDHFRGLFDKLDKNKDGFISREELQNEMRRIGAIDLDDIMTLFKELGLVISKPNAKRIIQMMDEDNSMTVDWEEFLQHVIINPAENIGELVSSWKHNLITAVNLHANFLQPFSSEDAPVEVLTSVEDLDVSVFGSKAVSLGLRELQTGGFRSLWQGNGVNVLKGTPQSTLQCFIYAQMRLSTLGERDSLTVHQRFGLGCVSGAVAHAVFYPLEVLKVRLNLQPAGTYNGVLGCAKLIYQNESVAAFYRGFKPSILCMIPYAGVECAVHQVFGALEESIISWVRQDPEHVSDSKLFLFSFAAFASGQATSYPLAVIRTQQQAQAFCSTSQKSADALQGLIGIYEKYGVRVETLVERLRLNISIGINHLFFFYALSCCGGYRVASPISSPKLTQNLPKRNEN